MKKYILAGLILGIHLLTCPAFAAEKPLANPGVLGEETIYTTTPLSRYKNLVIKDFPMDQVTFKNMNAEETARFQAIRPHLVNLLSEEFVREMQDKKLFDRVVRNGEAGPQTLILEGRFTKIDAGNRALKFFVGFGAGKSTLTMEGKLTDGATGEVLAVFENDRHAPFNMAEMEKVFDEDTRNLAGDLAEFLEKLYR